MSVYFIDYKGERFYRYGKIKVSNHFLINNHDLVYKAFERIRFLVTKVEQDLLGGITEFYGLSPAFKPIKTSENAPEYNLEIRADSFFDEASPLNVRVRQEQQE